MMNLFLVIIMMLTRGALAGDRVERDENGDRVVYKSKTEIDFEDLEIEGVLQKPQSALVLERKKANFNPLIKLRTDWRDAIEESVDEIK